MVGHFLRFLFNSQNAQFFVGTFFDLFFGEFTQFQTRKHHIAQNGKLIQQVVKLEYKPDFFITHTCQISFFFSAHEFTVNK